MVVRMIAGSPQAASPRDPPPRAPPLRPPCHIPSSPRGRTHPPAPGPKAQACFLKRAFLDIPEVGSYTEPMTGRPCLPRLPAGRPAGRQRLDTLLVQRGLAENRETARAAILAGAVLVDERAATGASVLVGPEAAIRVV